MGGGAIPLPAPARRRLLPLVVEGGRRGAPARWWWRRRALLLLVLLVSLLGPLRFFAALPRRPPGPTTTVPTGDRESVRSTPAACRAPARCPGGRVHRILLRPVARAGLNDRLFLLATLARVAARYCARLYVPTPRALLTEGHNAGFPPVGAGAWRDWEELVVLRFADDGSPAVITYQDEAEARRAPDGNGTWREVTSRSPAGAAGDVAAVDAWVGDPASAAARPRSDERILWVVDDFVKAYDTVCALEQRLRSEHDHDSDACRALVTIAPSDTIRNLTDALMARVEASLGQGPESPRSRQWIGSLHVRRNDAWDVCDTTKRTMRRWLACSFRDTSAWPMTFLLASDERRGDYRSYLLELPRRDAALNMSHVQFLDLDAMARSVVHGAVAAGAAPPYLDNNFVVYAVVKEAQRRAALHLSRRRHYDCQACNSVRAQIEALWNGSRSVVLEDYDQPDVACQRGYEK